MREEFRCKSSLIQPGSRVFRYSKMRTKNLAIRVTNLKSLDRLFDQIKEWEERNYSRQKD